MSFSAACWNTASIAMRWLYKLNPLKGRLGMVYRVDGARSRCGEAPRRQNAGKSHCLLFGCRGMAIIHLSTMASKNFSSRKSLKLINITTTNIANNQQASIRLCLPMVSSSQRSNRPACLYPLHTIAKLFESSLYLMTSSHGAASSGGTEPTL